MIIDLFEQLPPYHHLSVIHNDHRTNYISINDYLNEDYIKDFISYEDAQECLASDSIWELQIYPRTLISFYKTAAASLENALKLMLHNCKDGKWI